MVGLLGDMLEGSWNQNVKDQACGYKLVSKVNVYKKAVSAIAEFKKINAIIPLFPILCHYYSKAVS